VEQLTRHNAYEVAGFKSRYHTFRSLLVCLHDTLIQKGMSHSAMLELRCREGSTVTIGRCDRHDRGDHAVESVPLLRLPGPILRHALSAGVFERAVSQTSFGWEPEPLTFLVT
jgi:hypothetical protein